MSNKAPRGVRLVITLAGRRNAGKSSLINAIVDQDISIVSDQPGTTTDAVAKHYELLPLGPVTFYDTAGLDDSGELGELRIKATQKVLWRSDVAIVVIGEEGITDYEKNIISEICDLKIPFITIFNKNDLRPPSAKDISYCHENNFPFLEVSATNSFNIQEIKNAIIDLAPDEMKRDPVLAGDLFNEGDWVVCVVPIDLSAPKGRLILPQVQVLREILDYNAVAVTIKEHEIEKALQNLNHQPALVITDSQVVLSVANDVPDKIPLTTFSTLFARYKGDLPSLIKGADAIDTLEDGDIVLIGEACSHHPVEDDIGRVKIPNWIRQYTDKSINFETYSGHDFPTDLERYKLVIHCGACMLNRTEMLRRINECKRRNVPITNYGVAISKVQGVLERIIAPFNL
ncbi:[FeFe] hydrogenase H-cluster maturation GTPase HydF [Maridesulfovibrio ferrireducens]|uniref:[FeFe] hydrogenase H-cluster maturation GTPase HydF n=1 Tax=Maridesulfovibrio ferrireducens TaxID=246191 RepID=UPI001A2BF568|nr:[FeFe] hydrogenase H-cluster maturation GTPase HydF [Maridesulfovibrio ferrireducens]MBI9112777.1 [FeFe] hydrogenase H-cluster maturation GTPase HydF [Maridesulfovibrio ferrireducens]